MKAKTNDTEIRNETCAVKWLLLLVLTCWLFAACPPKERGNEAANGAGAANSDSSNRTPGNSDGELDAVDSRILDAKFYVDGDGNVVPDFIETELGFDPLADDCPYDDCGRGADGQEGGRRRQNTLLILDASGSMRAQNKMAGAKKALERYVRTVSTVQQLGFMVYGHRGDNSEGGKAESCAGVELLAPVGEVRRENFPALLARFEPTGWTPIAAALEQAHTAFAEREADENRVLLVSDGIETCGGDPVAAAEKLAGAGYRVRVDVVGFAVGTSDAAELGKIAEITGGEYFDAKTAADLDEYLKGQIDAVYETRRAIACEIGNLMHAPLCDQQLVNKAQFYLMKLRQESWDNQSRARRSGDGAALAREQAIARGYDDLLNRIAAAKNERERKSREAVPRYRELERKMNELGGQLREVYGGGQ